MTEDKIFLVKCKRQEIINRPTIKFIELTEEDISIIETDLELCGRQAEKGGLDIFEERRAVLLKKLSRMIE